MGELNLKRNAIYETEAPDIPGDENKRVPVLLHTNEHIVLDNVAEHSLTVFRTEYYLSLRNMAQDFELTLTAADSTPVGAMIYIDFANATGEETPHTLTVKAGESTVAAVATSLESTTACMFMYTGNGFVLMAAPAAGEGGTETLPSVAKLEDIVLVDDDNKDIVPESRVNFVVIDEQKVTNIANVNISAADAQLGDLVIVQGGGQHVPLLQNSAVKVFMFDGQDNWTEVLSVPMAAGGQGSMEAVWWDLSAEQSKVVGGNSESEVYVSIGGTCGGMANLAYGGQPKDGYKLYLTNTEPQSNASDTVDVMGKQVPLSDLMGTRVFVFANGMWN